MNPSSTSGLRAKWDDGDKKNPTAAEIRAKWAEERKKKEEISSDEILKQAQEIHKQGKEAFDKMEQTIQGMDDIIEEYGRIKKDLGRVRPLNEKSSWKDVKYRLDAERDAWDGVTMDEQPSYFFHILEKALSQEDMQANSKKMNLVLEATYKILSKEDKKKLADYLNQGK